MNLKKEEARIAKSKKRSSQLESELACVWHEEQFCTAGPVPRNAVGGLGNGKPWVSMPLSWNRFTMPTQVTFLAFGFSTRCY